VDFEIDDPMNHNLLRLSIIAIAACVPILPGDTASAQGTRNLREQAEEFRRGERDGVGSVSIREYNPKTIEQLTAESDLVVVCTLTRGKSYLSPNEEDVFTDYMISEYRILAGTLMSTSGPVGSVSPPVLTMFGGEVMLDGVPALTRNFNFGPFADGRYLLFLGRGGKEPWRYRLWHAGVFALTGEQVKPMLNQPDSVYVGVKQTPASTLIARVEQAAKGRSTPSPTPK
jgi:hypothetical protein